MFCSECGKEASGKFCCHCGTKLDVIDVKEQLAEISIDSNERAVIMPVIDDIDYDALLKNCEYSKTKAIVKLKEMTGLGLKECQELLNEPYRRYVDGNAKFAFSSLPPREDNTYSLDAGWEAEKQEYLVAKAAEDNRNTRADDTVRCPRCGSTQLSANKKGFGVGKSLAGAFVAGPIGLLAGGIGSGKVMVTCLGCGHSFKAGTHQ